MKEILKIINDILKPALIIAIKFYKYVISPMLPSTCRYLPTCSDYALESLKTHGILKGLFLTARRILKCNPFGGWGLDSVKKIKKL
jgi:putative membrane protein insertion efficiency factor